MDREHEMTRARLETLGYLGAVGNDQGTHDVTQEGVLSEHSLRRKLLSTGTPPEEVVFELQRYGYQ